MEKTKTEHSAGHFRGLYAITRMPDEDEALLAGQVEQAIMGGAKIIQYREKSAHREQSYRQCLVLLEICRAHSIPLIINDDVELAQKVGADGVHLGVEDSAYQQARDRLGTRAIIGISCYNQLARALEAEQQGADYVAFGRFFPSTSKPQAVHADLSLLQQARQQLRIPIVAIGGITPGNGKLLVEAGADMLAVIDALFGQQDIKTAAEAFASCFHD